MSTVNNGPQIVRSGLVLDLDASSVTSYSAIAVYKVECYSTLSGGLRSSNYTVQYSDDNSTWTTAFTGVMSNNSSCGIITGTNRNDSDYNKHRYWRYVEGAAIAGHHPRVSRIDFITKSGARYNLTTYTTDNCADSGTYIVGTVSKDFGTTTWRDISGNARNGTLTAGPTYSSSNKGTIVFDGTDDYVDVTYNSILNTPIGATYNIWIYPTQTGEFLNRGTSDSGATPDNPRFYIDVSNKNIYFDWSSVGADRFVTTSNNSFNNNSWIQITGLVTAGGRMDVYVNGSICTYNVRVNADVMPNPLPNTNNSIQIGGATWIPRYFGGRISTLSLYNRALTATEILQNFNATKTRFGL